MFGYLLLGTREVLVGDDLHSPLQPTFDDAVLGTHGDPSHLLHLRCWVPLPLHTVEGPEAEPDHSALLV